MPDQPDTPDQGGAQGKPGKSGKPGKPGKQDARSTREKAAAARAEALRAERARQRRTSILIGLGLVVLVGLIVGAVVWNNAQSSTPSGSVTLPAPDPGAALPTGVLGSDSDTAYGYPLDPAAGTPVLQVWEDFQCPICKEFEATYGSSLKKLAQDGTVKVVYRPTIFLDYSQLGLGTDHASARATSAWGCAIDAGVGEAYHSTVFANQPTEGVGYTQDVLKQFGATAGLSGGALTTFESCVDQQTYLGWASNSYQAFQDNGIPGTPNLVLNGKELPDSVRGLSPADFVAYITQHRND